MQLQGGRDSYQLRPIHDALMANLKRSTKLFMDETRAPARDQGAKKTKTGYFWALARDDRPWHRIAPPGVVYTYSPLLAKSRDGLGHFLTDGHIGIGNNSAECTIRPNALNHKNAVFAGQDAGAKNWAVTAALIKTCKMNGTSPHAWRANTLTAIIHSHKQSQIDDLLP